MIFLSLATIRDRLNSDRMFYSSKDTPVWRYVGFASQTTQLFPYTISGLWHSPWTQKWPLFSAQISSQLPLTLPVHWVNPGQIQFWLQTQLDIGKQKPVTISLRCHCHVSIVPMSSNTWARSFMFDHYRSYDMVIALHYTSSLYENSCRILYTAVTTVVSLTLDIIAFHIHSPPFLNLTTV